MTATSPGGGGTGLSAPTRNKYFYGKLLDVFHLDLEQRYGNQKRQLVNQQILGYGVVSGLDVVATGDGRVQIAPGLAIDGFGREIVVPEASMPFDPFQPTDDCGRPSGPRTPEANLTVFVAYHECETEHVPAPSCDCGCRTGKDCQASSVREQYKVIVTTRPGGEPPQLGCSMHDLWHQTEGNGLHASYGALAERVTRPYSGDPDGDGRVMLADVEPAPPPGSDAPKPVPDVAVHTDQRPFVVGNDILLEALVCLAEHVTPSPETTGITSVFPAFTGTVTESQFLGSGIAIDFGGAVTANGPAEGWLTVDVEYLETQTTPARLAETRVRRVPGTAAFSADATQLTFVPNPDFAGVLSQAGAATAICRVVLRTQALGDERGKAVDGDFTGRFPTGDGQPGGDFETWFTLTQG